MLGAFEFVFRAIAHTADMNSRSQDSLTIDAFAAFAQPLNSNLSCGGAPASETKAGANRVIVVRRLQDDVQLSRESGRDEESAASLCSSFMAAWD